MENTKNTPDNQTENGHLPKNVLLLQVNGLRLEISSQNGQYSENELRALIKSLVVNVENLFPDVEEPYSECNLRRLETDRFPPIYSKHKPRAVSNEYIDRLDRSDY